MTPPTVRHRRNSSEQARDILKAQLRRQMARAARLKVPYDKVGAEIEKTILQLGALEPEPLPDMGTAEVAPSLVVFPPPERYPGSSCFSDLTSVAGRNPMLLSQDALSQDGPDVCPLCGSDPGHKVNCPRGCAFTSTSAQDTPSAPRSATVDPAAESVGAETPKPILYAKPVYGACAPEVEGHGPHLHEEKDGKWYCVGKE